MFLFSSLLFILQTINVRTTNDALGKKLQVTLPKLSGVQIGRAQAKDNTSYSKFDPWLNVYIPRPLLLNERIKNPKFISKHPKRKKTSHRDKASIINKTRPVKNKKAAVSAPYANILNTNYKYIFLARMKNKDKNQTLQTALSKKKNNILKEFASPLDVRLGLSRTRKNRVIRRRKKKN